MALMISLAFSLAITVIDGDTLKINGETIRMWGIDAPEIFRAHCQAEHDLGERSAQFLALKVARAERVVASPMQNNPDRYGRTVARIIIDGQDTGAILVEKNLARPWDYDGGEKKPDWCG